MGSSEGDELEWVRGGMQMGEYAYCSRKYLRVGGETTLHYT